VGDFMDYRSLSILESMFFIGLLLIAAYLLVPKAIEQWRLWKKTNKFSHLSTFILLGFVAICFFLGLLIRFLRVAMGG
jgi:TRAP-type mannitol/chloroaromatic compound transport system permease small subunit